jgi:predicted ArsR family transcriptional regulator
MADAICDSTRTGAPIAEAIGKAASVRGAALAATAADRPPEADAALELAVRILSQRGYEPRRTNHAIVMANCPFHALAAEHTELVCRMNHSMLAAFVDAMAPGLLEASLEPARNRCCVTLTTHSGDKQMTETTS